VQSDFSSNAASPGPVFWLVWCAVIVFCVASLWKVFTKAGQPGWAAIIPIYNLVVLCQIAGKPVWWVLLMFIPIANIIVAVMIWHGVSKAFGHGAGFTAGLVLLGFIFIPILAWGDSQYLGPNAQTPVPV
jgi:hypothetical protein